MAEGLRLDKFLWFARIVKTRGQAQALAEAGHIRRNRQPVERPSTTVRIGDVLTVPQRGAVRVLRIEALPARRGPPAVARALYSELSAESE